MNKQALLEETYNLAFKDELEKCAISIPYSQIRAMAIIGGSYKGATKKAIDEAIDYAAKKKKKAIIAGGVAGGALAGGLGYTALKAAKKRSDLGY